MTYQVRFTPKAKDDLERLYDFLLDLDPHAAGEALATIEQAVTMLERFPFSCRKAAGGRYGTFLRELIVPFGNAGCVALFEIADKEHVNILAVRHQKETDYF